LISLSSVNNSQCKTLLNLAQIKKRNKPKEAPKAPEKAPFFLPTISGAIPKFDASKTEEEETDKPSKNNLDLRTGSEFIEILKECTLNKNCMYNRNLNIYFIIYYYYLWVKINFIINININIKYIYISIK